MNDQNSSAAMSMTHGFCERRAKILDGLVSTYLPHGDENVTALLDHFLQYEEQTAPMKAIGPIRGVDVSDLVTYVNNFCERSTRQMFHEGMKEYIHPNQSYEREVRECAGITYVGRTIDDALILDGIAHIESSFNSMMPKLEEPQAATQRINRRSAPILYFNRSEEYHA